MGHPILKDPKECLCHVCHPCWCPGDPYNTVTTLGAPFKPKPVAKRHHMVSGTLAPFYTVFGLQLGCNGAAAPIRDEVL